MSSLKTVLKGKGKEVIISWDRPVVIIGERINPTGKEKLAAALLSGDLEPIRQEALAQVEAGADVLDVNVGIAGVDEVEMLPEAVRVVIEAVDVPVCIDSANPDALAAALAVHRQLAPDGKPLINSVSGKEKSLERVLPLAKEYGAAVIGLCMDDEGIPSTPERRLEVARKIVERAEAMGIPREDVVIDCLALTMGADPKAGWVALEAIRMVKAELGVNMTLGVSNISFGLPERRVINGAFVAMAIAAGVTCPIGDAAKLRPYILAADLILGRDEYAMRYIRAFRRRKMR